MEMKRECCEDIEKIVSCVCFGPVMNGTWRKEHKWEEDITYKSPRYTDRYMDKKKKKRKEKKNLLVMPLS